MYILTCLCEYVYHFILVISHSFLCILVLARILIIGWWGSSPFLSKGNIVFSFYIYLGGKKSSFTHPMNFYHLWTLMKHSSVIVPFTEFSFWFGSSVGAICLKGSNRTHCWIVCCFQFHCLKYTINYMMFATNFLCYKCNISPLMHFIFLFYIKCFSTQGFQVTSFKWCCFSSTDCILKTTNCQ